MQRRSLLVPLAVVVLCVAGCGDDADTRSETAGMPSTIQDLQAETWVLDVAASTPDIGSGSATIVFGDGRVHGTSPCNSYSGPFELDGDEISLGPLVSTMRACVGDLMAGETAFLGALETVDGVEVDDDTLTLSGADVSLVFEALDVDEALVGTWSIVDVADGDAIVSVIDGSDPTLTLDSDGAAGIATGCNQGATTWERDGDDLTFGLVAGTLMACEDDLMQQQDALFAALESTSTFELAPGQLTLLDDDGHILLTAVDSDS